MARFVMTNRRAGKFRAAEKRSSRSSLDFAFSAKLERNVNVIGDTQPQDDEARRVVVFEATPEEVAAKSAELPADVIVEPEILHFPLNGMRFHTALLPFVAGAQPLEPGAGAGTSMSTRVQGEGRDLLGAKVTLYLRGALGRSVKIEQFTPESGTANFTYDAYWSPTTLVVEPAGGFWSYVVRGPKDGELVNLPRLPEDGPLGWWHRALGIQEYDAERGLGIKVGVIDTGCGPHPHLSHVTHAGTFLDGNINPAAAGDADSHGTHVCGTVGARPAPGSSAYAGVAPGVELFSACVFAPGRGANQGDIANAIDVLFRAHEVDLINMSLGAGVGSEVLSDAITDALEGGALCVCAAGNSAGPVEYPAAFRETIGVGALGLEGWGEPGTLSANRYPLETDKYGDENLYLGNFSCFGDRIDCCAPGVGVIAPVPERFGLGAPSAVMDGTSMASPAACAVLAAALSGDAAYLTLPRSVTRAEKAREALQGLCRDLRMAATYQGRGIPRV